VLSDSERRTVRELEAALLTDPAFIRSLRPVDRLLERLAAPVVVGVSTDPASSAALSWAATEAVARGRPLRIVHAFWSPVVIDPFGVVPALDSLATQQAAAAELVEAARRWVRSVAPGLEVSASIVRDNPRRLLLRESRKADVLVVGSRRPGAPLPDKGCRLRGPLVARLTTSACCPITVVHPGSGADSRGAPRVVVGIDGRTGPDVVGFAFRAAAQRGLPLTAVHAWTAGSVPDRQAPATTEAAAYALLDDVVSTWRAMYPRVPLVRDVVRLDPATALISGSRGAALVVVGTRGRRLGRGALHASVSRAVVDGATVPVAVVRAGSDVPVGG
jgi:nucleotide-binding universal stress UspA family protein